MNAGLGGDFFALIYNAFRGKVIGLNGSGKVTARVYQITKALISKSSIPPQGVLSAITVPGAVAAWCALHKKFGKLEWKTLFHTAIGYAFKGFEMSPHTRKNWDHIQRFVEGYISGKISKAVFEDFMHVYSPGSEYSFDYIK